MKRLALTLATLLLLPTCLIAEDNMKISVRMSLQDVSVSVTGATEEDIESGLYKELLFKAGREARDAWKCAIHDRCYDFEEN